MTSALLGWFIAGICSIAFLVLWFAVNYRVLSEKKKSLDAAQAQVVLHKKILMQERGGENDSIARNVLESRRMVFRMAASEYNSLLEKPLYFIPGYIMGFRRTTKDGER